MRAHTNFKDHLSELSLSRRIAINIAIMSSPQMVQCFGKKKTGMIN